MKQTFLFVITLSVLVLCITSAQACSDSTAQLLQQAEQLAEQTATACRTTQDCSGACQAALSDWFNFVNECGSVLDSSKGNFSSVQQVVLAWYIDLCEGDLASSIKAVFGSLCEGSLSAAAQNVLTKCADRAGQECSGVCSEAFQSYYKELYACISYQNENAQVLQIRSQVESVCSLISASRECALKAQAELAALRSACPQQSFGECASSCQQAINALTLSTSTDCPSYGENLVSSYNSFCDSTCGPAAVQAFYTVLSECQETTNLCGSSCLSSLDSFKASVECFDTDSVLQRVATLIWDIGNSACSSALALAAGCSLSSLSYYEEVMQLCALGGICTSECYSATQNLDTHVTGCYKKLLPSDIATDLQRIESVCELNGTGLYSLHIADWTVSEIAEASREFLQRVATAFGVTLQDIDLMLTSESVGAKRSESTTVEVTVSGSTSDPDFTAVGVEATSVTQVNKETSGSPSLQISAVLLLVLSAFLFF